MFTDGGGCDDKSNLVLKSERFKTVELRVLTLPTGVGFKIICKCCSREGGGGTLARILYMSKLSMLYNCVG